MRKRISKKEVIKLLKKGLKRCGKCKLIKPIKKFSSNKSNTTSKLSWECKKCKNIYGKSYWKKNKKRLRIERKDFYNKNKEKIQLANKKRNDKYGFAYRLKTRYNMTVKDYDKMLKGQKGGCWICGKLPKTRRLSIDHSHKTGQIRGLLCHRCNRGLAWFSDNPKLLNRAAKYLMKGD